MKSGEPSLLSLFALAVFAGPLLFVCMLGLTPGIGFTEDLGRHLLLGKLIWQQGVVPHTNLLTHTHPDFPFINHHWLFEVSAYLYHDFFGYNGLIILKMGLLAVILSLSCLTICPDFKKINLTSVALQLTALLSAVILGFRSHIRPELYSYLFIALFLFLFERQRSSAKLQLRQSFVTERWILLLAMLLWVNTHIYFIFGLGMLAAFCLEQIMVHRSRRTVLREVFWLVLCFSVCLINPNGLEGMLYPLNIFNNYQVVITENNSPLTLWHSVVNPMLMALPLLTLVVLAAIAAQIFEYAKGWVKLSDLRIANTIIVSVSVAASWYMARSVPLLAITAVPFIVNAVKRLPFIEKKWLIVSGAGVLLITNLLLIYSVVEGSYSRVFPSPVGPTPFGLDQEDYYLQMRKLQTKHDLKGPIYNDFNIGSLVEYNLFPLTSYADNRPEAFPGDFWNGEYSASLDLGREWQEIYKKRGFNTAIVSLTGVGEKFVQKFNSMDDWVLIHLNGVSALWVRHTKKNHQTINQLTFGRQRIDEYTKNISRALITLESMPFWRRQVEIDHLVMELYSLICIGENTLAWPYLWQLYLLYPDYQIVHELLRVTAPVTANNLLEPLWGKHARWPLSVRQVLYWGDYLLNQEQVAEAEKVYRRGKLFFPLSPVLKERVQQCEKALRSSKG